MTSKAPAGGVVSVVNGQFYEGGEFIPDTGVYCGKKGAKRKKAVERFKPAGRVYGNESSGRLWEVERRGSFPWMAVVWASNREEAVSIVTADGVRGPFFTKEVS